MYKVTLQPTLLPEYSKDIEAQHMFYPYFYETTSKLYFNSSQVFFLFVSTSSILVYLSCRTSQMKQSFTNKRSSVAYVRELLSLAEANILLIDAFVFPYAVVLVISIILFPLPLLPSVISCNFTQHKD